jgi:hypothetical protein
MDARSFDDVTKQMTTTASRRGILRGLGALGVGSLAVLGLAEAGSAEEVGVEGAACRRCVRRCERRCDNRGRRCLVKCVDRRCTDDC